jgi:serine/threonine protein kinase
VVALVRRLGGERPSRPSPAAPATGDDDRFTIEREIGRGAVATVYLARDRKHDRRVALKVLRPEIGTGSDRRRFEREIAILARLHHPHILPLYDSGVLTLTGDRDGLFYVMPYVEGDNLRVRLEREGRLPVAESVHLAREVAGALAYAHGQGIIHRDVRPENILLESGHALVADFGIARALEASAGEQISTVGVVLGHPAYMSPEQARGTPELDPRSDIYSLGCVLYEMLAGVPPFSGATRAAMLARHISDVPPPLRTLRPDVPPWLERVIMQALAKRPADRVASATEFARALEPA